MILLLGAVLLLPVAYMIGGFNGASLAGCLLAGFAIARTVRRGR